MIRKRSLTTETIEKYYDIYYANEDSITADEKFFIYHIEFELAQSIIREFGKTTAKRLAKIILADTDE